MKLDPLLSTVILSHGIRGCDSILGIKRSPAHHPGVLPCSCSVSRGRHEDQAYTADLTLTPNDASVLR